MEVKRNTSQPWDNINTDLVEEINVLKQDLVLRTYKINEDLSEEFKKKCGTKISMSSVIVKAIVEFMQKE